MPTTGAIGYKSAIAKFLSYLGSKELALAEPTPTPRPNKMGLVELAHMSSGQYYW